MAVASDRNVVVATSIPPVLARQDAGRPFGEEYQRLCLESWTTCGFRVISVNSRDEIAALQPRFPEVSFVPAVRNARAMSGRDNPYIADLLFALAEAPEPIAGIINSDLLFEPSSAWRDAMPRLAASAVLTAQRYDTASLQAGALHKYHWGLDCFFFDRALAAPLALAAMPHAMGLPWWDYWLPAACLSMGRDVLAIGDPHALHLQHKDTGVDDNWRLLARDFARFVIREAGAPSRTPPERLASVLPVFRNVAAAPADSHAGMADIAILQMATNYIPILHQRVVSFDRAESLSQDPILTGAFCDFQNRAAAGAAQDTAKQLEEQGKSREADIEFRRALALAPDDADLLQSYGEHLVRRGNLAGAAAALRRAVELEPASATRANALGTILHRMQNYGDAVLCFQKALEAEPGHLNTYCNLAVTLDRLGRRGEAKAHLDRVLALRPDFAEAQQLHRRLFG